MSKPNQQRISTSGPQQGMGNPFGELAFSGLPEGPQKEAVQPQPCKFGRLHIRREKAHRGGKVVTVVFGFDAALPQERLEELGRALRNGCGSGGTVRERTLEIQGDQEAKVRALLEKIL